MQSACGNGRGLASAPRPISISSAISRQEAGIFIATARSVLVAARMEKAKGRRRTREDMTRGDSRTGLTTDRHKRCSVILRPCHFIIVLGHFFSSFSTKSNSYIPVASGQKRAIHIRFFAITVFHDTCKINNFIGNWNTLNGDGHCDAVNWKTISLIGE